MCEKVTSVQVCLASLCLLIKKCCYNYIIMTCYQSNNWWCLFTYVTLPNSEKLEKSEKKLNEY